MLEGAVDKWARVLTEYSVGVNAGQTVVVTGGTAGEPLLQAVYRQIVDKGAHPIMIPILPGISEYLLEHGNDDQLEFQTPTERFMREEADIVITIYAQNNTRHLSGVEPERQSMFKRARTPLLTTFLNREALGQVDWTLTLYPTDSHAQDAEMSTTDFTDFVYRACKLHEDDPVAAWQTQAKEQQRLIDWLDGKSEVHVTGTDTDLTLSVNDRTWINADGRKNFPDGEIFTGPVESSASGTIRFSFPAIESGREVEDIRLRFENGKVVDASAARGEDLLIAQLDTDEGARFIGEFAFGTNFDISRYIKQLLFDEKIGGTIHLAVGSGYPETGNTNKSAVHWDMVCDLREGGRVTVDGEPFLVDGTFVV